MHEDVRAQREYYRATAARYDEMHSGAEEENLLALSLMLAGIDLIGATSVLEVGSGTGRALLWVKAARPSLRVVGIEPSADLREQGYRKGLSANELRDGDALALPYGDGEFDLVFETACLHHLRTPRIAVGEMLRVASKAIFISDSNNFGQGSFLARRIKQAINALGLWRAFDLLRTRGRGYHWSEGDGVYYSYSVFNDFPLIRERCASVHVMNVGGASISHYRDAPAVAVLGIKRP